MRPPSASLRIVWCAGFIATGVYGCSKRTPVTPTVAAHPMVSGDGCVSKVKAGPDGVRRIALLVGYGPDVAAMSRILMDGGFGFPSENICVLPDHLATLASVERAFSEALIDRVRQDDVALFYFAGKGTHAPDGNGDEPDGRDELLVLRDGGWVDDAIDAHVERLTERCRNSVVIIDASAHGSFGGLSRTVEPRSHAFDTGHTKGDGSNRWLRPRASVIEIHASGALEAARVTSDGLLGHLTLGLTELLLDPLGPTRWSEMSAQLPRAILASSSGLQHASMLGARASPIFGTRARARSVSWRVVAVDDAQFKLQGPKLPGWDEGALVNVYARSGAAEPRRPKGVLKIESIEEEGVKDTLRAVAVLDETPRAPVKPGDIVTLLLPAAKLEVSVHGLPDEHRGRVQKEIGLLGRPIALTTQARPLGVAMEDGQLVIRAADKVLNRFTGSMSDQAIDLAQALDNHATQLGLLRLRAQGGQDFVEGRTLEIDIEPVDGTGSSDPDEGLPLGSKWRVRVANTDDRLALSVGGVILWSDGHISAFPPSGSTVLPPRSKPSPIATLVAKRPADRRISILVFGTRPSRPVDWRVFQRDGPFPGMAESEPDIAALGKAIKSVTVASRGRGRADRTPERVIQDTWTSSHISVRVVDAAK